MSLSNQQKVLRVSAKIVGQLGKYQVLLCVSLTTVRCMLR